MDPIVIRSIEADFDAGRYFLAAERALDSLRSAYLRLKDADHLADEVQRLVERRVIDARSPAADALLDFRNPPNRPSV